MRLVSMVAKDMMARGGEAVRMASFRRSAVEQN